MTARDVLYQAKVYSDLKKAICDTYLVIGTTRRSGAKRGTFLPFTKAIEKIKKVSSTKTAAILFGKESKGLDNPSLNVCDWVTTIPANPVYPSLNLAQAVIVVTFSLRQKELRTLSKTVIPAQAGIHKPLDSRFRGNDNYVPKKTTEDVLKRLGRALHSLNYEEEGGDVINRILATFSGLFKRNGLIEREAQMLKGISRRICEKNKTGVIPHG